MTKQADIDILSEKISTIKKEIQGVGRMRPGSINEQFKDPKAKSGAYYQLNYTHKMKTHTEYIRKGNLATLQGEVAEYQRLRVLFDEWIALSIQVSKLRLKQKSAQD